MQFSYTMKCAEFFSVCIGRRFIRSLAEFCKIYLKACLEGCISKLVKITALETIIFGISVLRRPYILILGKIEIPRLWVVKTLEGCSSQLVGITTPETIIFGISVLKRPYVPILGEIEIPRFLLLATYC